MKCRLAVVVAIVLVAALAAAPPASAQTKWVRGTVASVGPDSVTVAVAGTNMTFKVTAKTELTARGAGTAQRRAEDAGQKGVRFTEFVKPGMGVEVHYTEAAGVLTATDIHSGLAPTDGSMGPAPADSGSARGSVAAIGGASITVKGADQEWTFAIDQKTTVVGEGLGTLTRKFRAEGKSPTVADLIGVGDKVIVYYSQAGSAKLAKEIRVLAKAAK